MGVGGWVWWWWVVMGGDGGDLGGGGGGWRMTTCTERVKVKRLPSTYDYIHA